MNNFCTLFDSNYLTRGLAMYNSLVTVGEEFTLYIICFDTLCFSILQNMQLPNIFLIPLGEFETEELIRVKGERTAGEYCWTCTSHVIRHVLEKYKLSEVTYLDADTYFFEKPSILLHEFIHSGKSVMITPHRYTRKYDQSRESGIYCVQFITFKNTPDGLEALQWWQDKCLEWCFDRKEDGKFGDQKYLDDWPDRFQGIHVLKHLGGGVAPWNIQQYAIKKAGNGLVIDGQPLVFYHFHQFKMYDAGYYDLGYYELSKDAVDWLYRLYAKILCDVEKEVKKIVPDFRRGYKKKQKKTRIDIKFYSQKTERCIQCV